MEMYLGGGYINIKYATTNIQQLIISILSCLGEIGNIIFIMCSSWFLLEKNKINRKKLIQIILNSLIISILYLVILSLFGFHFNKVLIIKQFLPITMKNNWFIGCYLLFYMLTPYLNIIIKNIDKKNLQNINIVLFILYSGFYFVLGNNAYYFNELIGFIYIYLIVAYVKMYMLDFQKNISLNKKLLIFSLIGFIGSMLLTNYIGLSIPLLSSKLMHWNKLTNPFYLLFSISLLNIFKNRNFYNKTINYISSLSLIIYLIHENILFRDYIRPIFYNSVFKYQKYILWIFIEIILLILYSLILSIIYNKTVQKFLNYIIEKKLKFE